MNRQILIFFLGPLMLLAGCQLFDGIDSFHGGLHGRHPRIWFCDSCKTFNSPDQEHCKGKHCGRRYFKSSFFEKCDLDRYFKEIERAVNSNTWSDELPLTFDTWLCATCESYNNQNTCTICGNSGVPAGKKVLLHSLQTIVAWLNSRWDLDGEVNHFRSACNTWVCDQCNYFNGSNQASCKYCSKQRPRPTSKQAAAFMQYVASAAQFYTTVKKHHDVLANKRWEEQREKITKARDEDRQRPRPWFCQERCDGTFNDSDAAICKVCHNKPHWTEWAALLDYFEDQERILQLGTSWLNALPIINKHCPDRHWLCVRCCSFNEQEACHCGAVRSDNDHDAEAKTLLVNLQVLIKWLKKEDSSCPRSNDLWICNACQYFNSERAANHCGSCSKSYTETESDKKQVFAFLTYAKSAAALMNDNQKNYDAWLAFHRINIGQLERYMNDLKVTWATILEQWEKEGDIYLEAFLPCQIMYHIGRKDYFDKGHGNQRIMSRAREDLNRHLSQLYVAQQTALGNNALTWREFIACLGEDLLKQMESVFIQKHIKHFDQNFIVQPFEAYKKRIQANTALLERLQNPQEKERYKRCFEAIIKESLAKDLIAYLIKNYTEAYSTGAIGLPQEITQELKIMLYLWPEIKEELKEQISPDGTYAKEHLAPIILQILEGLR